MTTDISVGVRWDPLSQQEVIEDYDFEYDGGNSSSRLFERSRIRALAGRKDFLFLKWKLKNVCREISQLFIFETTRTFENFSWSFTQRKSSNIRINTIKTNQPVPDSIVPNSPEVAWHRKSFFPPLPLRQTALGKGIVRIIFHNHWWYFFFSEVQLVVKHFFFVNITSYYVNRKY